MRLNFRSVFSDLRRMQLGLLVGLVVATLILPPGLLPDVVTSHTTVVAETSTGPDPCTIDSDHDGIYDCYDACPAEHGQGSADGCPFREHHLTPEETCEAVGDLTTFLSLLGIGIGIAASFIAPPLGIALALLAASYGGLSELIDMLGDC